MLNPKLKTGKKAKRRDGDYGKHGPLFIHVDEEGTERYYPWNLKAGAAIRGYQRKGIRARDLFQEAVFKNEETAPRIEVPRSIIRGMRVETATLTAADMAIFWRCFAQARLQGMQSRSHSIRLGNLAKFLGWGSMDRVKKCLERLRTAAASQHFNQEGHHGRKSLPLLILEQDSDEVQALKSCGEVRFSLPQALCDAAMVAKDYGLVDLNALARFKSRFSSVFFMRMSLLAGYHDGLRKECTFTLEQLAMMFGLPLKTRRSTLLEVMHTVQDDLEAISGPRKRFSTFITWPNGTDEFFTVNVTSSIKRTRDVKPAPLADEMKELICDRTKFRIKNHEYPNLLVIRQAAALHSVSPVVLSEQWRLQVWKARTDSTHTVDGMTSSELFDLIARYGADSVFEAFSDKADLSHVGSKREEPVSYGRGIRPVRYRDRRSRAVTVTDVVAKAEEVEDDDCQTYGSVELDYGSLVPSRRPVRFTEINDDDIDF